MFVKSGGAHTEHKHTRKCMIGLKIPISNALAYFGHIERHTQILGLGVSVSSNKQSILLHLSCKNIYSNGPRFNII
jgi:hypothetical protein